MATSHLCCWVAGWAGQLADTDLTSASPQPQHSVLRMQRMRTSAWLLALLLLAAVAGPAAAFWGEWDPLICIVEAVTGKLISFAFFNLTFHISISFYSITFIALIGIQIHLI